MSQNAHSLMLFFDDEAQHKNCLLMLLKLDRGDHAQAQTWALRLGVDLSEDWNEHWFNHAFKARPEFLKLDYETSTSYGLPLEALHRLFGKGLKAAVLEIFHDQVGEYRRYHFLDNRLVNRQDLYAIRPQARALIEAEIPMSEDEDEDYSVSTPKPITLDELIAKQAQSSVDSQDMLQSLLAFGQLARETGGNPVQLIKSALILRAMGIGLLQAAGFSLITVLLFKGLWLWIGLGVLLAVILPMLYANRVIKDFSDDHDTYEEYLETATDAD